MAKKVSKKKQIDKQPMLFGKENYKWMFIGLGLIILGFILMSGGGSKDIHHFNPEIFSFRRIRLAPLLVIAGFFTEIYAILKNPDKQA